MPSTHLLSLFSVLWCAETGLQLGEDHEELLWEEGFCGLCALNKISYREAWGNRQPGSLWPFSCIMVINPKQCPAPLSFIIFLVTSGPQRPWQLTVAHHIHIKAISSLLWSQFSWSGTLWLREWLWDVAEQQPHLEVPVDNAHSMEIVDGIQDLADQSAGIFLCVKSFLHYPIKQLSTGYTVKKKKRTNLKFERTSWTVHGVINKSFNTIKDPSFIPKMNPISDLHFSPPLHQKLYQGSVSMPWWYTCLEWNKRNKNKPEPVD